MKKTMISIAAVLTLMGVSVPVASAADEPSPFPGSTKYGYQSSDRPLPVPSRTSSDTAWAWNLIPERMAGTLHYGPTTIEEANECWKKLFPGEAIPAAPPSDDVNRSEPTISWHRMRNVDADGNWYECSPREITPREYKWDQTDFGSSVLHGFSS